MELKRCPFCAEEIFSDAIKCKHCGEILDKDIKQARQEASGQKVVIAPYETRRWSPGVAALLSFLIPGAGQLYKGHVGRGLLWFIGVIIGYFFLIIPGLLLHLACIVSATMGDPYKD